MERSGVSLPVSLLPGVGELESETEIDIDLSAVIESVMESVSVKDDD